MTTLIAKATLMMLSYEVRNFDSAGAEYVQVFDSPGQLKTIKGKK